MSDDLGRARIARAFQVPFSVLGQPPAYVFAGNWGDGCTGNEGWADFPTGTMLPASPTGKSALPVGRPPERAAPARRLIHGGLDALTD